MSDVVGKVVGSTTTMRPPPWHVCARAIDDQVSFKIWTGDNPEPTWDDLVAARNATVPAEWVYSGYTGGYAGHIHVGHTEHISGITSSVLPVEPTSTSTTLSSPAIP